MSGNLTSAHIATALVAACAHYGLNPTEAFDAGHRKGTRNGVGPYGARVLAAAGLRARMGFPTSALAKVMKIAGSDIGPASLLKRGVVADDLLAIAQALEASGLASGKAAVTDGRFRKAAETAPAPVVPPRSSDVAPVAKVEASKPEPRRAGPGWAQRGSRSSLKAAPKVVSKPGPVRRMKAVTANIVRWTRQQLALGADLDFVADCFGVDVDALADAVRPESAVAA